MIIDTDVRSDNDIVAYIDALAGNYAGVAIDANCVADMKNSVLTNTQKHSTFSRHSCTKFQSSVSSNVDFFLRVKDLLFISNDLASLYPFFCYSEYVINNDKKRLNRI